MVANAGVAGVAVGKGARVVTTCVWIGERCGVDEGFKGVVEGAERAWDGPITEPCKRRSSS